MKLRCASAVFAGLLVFAACGGDDEPAAESADSTLGAPTTTTVALLTVPGPDGPETTVGSTTPDSVPVVTATTDALGNDLTCGGEGPLADLLMDYANQNSPSEGIEFLVTEVVISTEDATWGRGQVSAPPDSGVEGFIGVAKCEDLGEGLAWNLKDSGTSGIGCMPDVPSDIAFDC